MVLSQIAATSAEGQTQEAGGGTGGDQGRLSRPVLCLAKIPTTSLSDSTDTVSAEQEASP